MTQALENLQHFPSLAILMPRPGTGTILYSDMCYVLKRIGYRRLNYLTGGVLPKIFISANMHAFALVFQGDFLQHGRM